MLEDPQYAEHPLREALADLVEHVEDRQTKLERVIRISDRYQALFHDHVVELSRRYDRRVRTLERAVRVSERNQAELEDENQSLQVSATHDQLTGVPNRRMISQRCRAEDARTTRDGSTYTLALIDIDHFKSFNDAHGHAIGDAVLVELAAVLRSSVREFDVCGRWGGEEFLALFVDTDLASAEVIVRRLIDKVRNISLNANGQDVKVTVSIGLAQHILSEAYTDTFTRADEALYRAKDQGRDCYVIAPNEPVDSDGELERGKRSR